MREMIMKNKSSSKDFGLVITDWERPLQAENRDEYVALIGVDGDILVPKEKGNQNITITFEKLINGALDWKVEEREIKKWLNSREEVRMEFDDEQGVYYIGKVRSSSKPIYKRVAIEFTIEIVCQAFSVAKEKSTFSYAGNTASEEDSFNFNSDGSAHSEFILKITPHTEIENLKINVNGVDLVYEAKMQAGQTLKVDTENFMCYLNDVNVTLNLIGEFPIVIPGKNKIKLRTGNTFQYTVNIEFDERFL